MPLFSFGAFNFTYSGATSGYGPKSIQGPERASYVVEHQIPGREGGIVEYLGSEQSRYTLRGFVSPPAEGPPNGTAALFLSGNSYLAQSADIAANLLAGLRGSGAQALKIESTYSNFSGYMSMYENGLFVAEKLILAYETGRGYPYYPYTLSLRRASPATYGDSSGASQFNAAIINTNFPAMSGNYYSGYIFLSQLKSGVGTPGGMPNGEVVNTLGVYVLSVASGNLKVGIYSGTSVSSGSNALAAQSAPQAVISGWNYFPIRPSFQTVSGSQYLLVWVGDATSSNGFVVAYDSAASNNLGSAVMSGVGFSSAFPSTFSSLSGGLYGLTPFDVIMAVA